MRTALWMALAACGGAAGPATRSPEPTDAVVQVQAQVTSLDGVALPRHLQPPLDIWVSRGIEDRVAEGTLRPGEAASLTAPAGTWEVWVASAWPAARDTGRPAQRCTGHLTDVELHTGATTVVTVAVRCGIEESG